MHAPMHECSPRCCWPRRRHARPGDQAADAEEAGQEGHRQGGGSRRQQAAAAASAWCHACPGPIATTTASLCLRLHAPPPHARTQAFIKTVNYNHLMPTRYTLDLDLKNVTTEVLNNSTEKVDARKVGAGRAWARGHACGRARACAHARTAMQVPAPAAAWTAGAADEAARAAAARALRGGAGCWAPARAHHLSPPASCAGVQEAARGEVQDGEEQVGAVLGVPHAVRRAAGGRARPFESAFYSLACRNHLDKRQGRVGCIAGTIQTARPCFLSRRLRQAMNRPNDSAASPASTTLEKGSSCQMSPLSRWLRLEGLRSTQPNAHNIGGFV